MSRERLYQLPIAEGWYEVDSHSDGMSGRITIEHPETTMLTSFHWSVSGRCTSQHAAREAARAWIAAGCPEDE